MDGRDGALVWCGVPDGEDTTGLGEGVLLLDATDALLQDGGDLGGGGLSIGGVGAGSGERRGAGLWEQKWSVVVGDGCEAWLGRGELPSPSRQRAPQPGIHHHCSFNALPMASAPGSSSCRRRRRWRQAQWLVAAVDLPMQSCSRQRLRRPGGWTGGWPLRT